MDLVDPDEEPAVRLRLMHDLAEFSKRDDNITASLDLVDAYEEVDDLESKPETEPPNDFEPWSDSDASSIEFESELEEELDDEGEDD